MRKNDKNDKIHTMKPIITYDDFAKLDLKIGVIISAEIVPESKKLLKLMVDAGEGEPRQVLAGIKKSYEDVSMLIGKQVVLLANLEPKELAGLTSHGMLLAATGAEGLPILLAPESPAKTGAGNEVR